MKKILMCLFYLFSASHAFADKLGIFHNQWGILFLHRKAQESFAPNGFREDIVPSLFYEDKNFYVQGLEAGYKLIKISPKQDFRLITIYRFFDIPEFYRTSRIDGIDSGLQYHYEINSFWDLYASLLSDIRGRLSSEFISTWLLTNDYFSLHVYLDLLSKSAPYNDHYYGIDQKLVGNDVDTSVGFDLKVKVFKNVYINVGDQVTYFGERTVTRSQVQRPYQETYYFGAGMMSDSKISKVQSPHHHRVGYGMATPTNTKEIILDFRSEPDEFKNAFASYFYGFPVCDAWMGLNVPVYFEPGLAYHLRNKFQNDFLEYVAMIKLYYTIPLPWKFRIGLGEGLSYSTEISHIEKREMDSRKLQASRLLNYLDFSLDFSLQSIGNIDFLKGLWVGWYLHHRSGIYGSSTLFNRVSGGSNYNTFYALYEF